MTSHPHPIEPYTTTAEAYRSGERFGWRLGLYAAIAYHQAAMDQIMADAASELDAYDDPGWIAHHESAAALHHRAADGPPLT